jgi:hypothetical protein
MKRRLAQIVVLLLAAACSETSHLPTAPRARNTTANSQSSYVVTPSGVTMDADEYARFGQLPKVQTPARSLAKTLKSTRGSSLRAKTSNLKVAAGKTSNSVSSDPLPHVLCYVESILLCDEMMNQGFISDYQAWDDEGFTSAVQVDFEQFDLIFIGDMPAAPPLSALSNRFCDMVKEFVGEMGGGVVFLSDTDTEVIPQLVARQLAALEAASLIL